MFGNFQYQGGPLGNFFAQNTPQSLLARLFGGGGQPQPPQLRTVQPQPQPLPAMQAPPMPAQAVQQMAAPPPGVPPVAQVPPAPPPGAQTYGLAGQLAPKVGSVSAKYESGGGGYGTISSGKGDRGGKSYGKHQLASKTGSLDAFLRRSGYDATFQGLAPGSSAFDAKWKEMANDPSFGAAQDAHIMQTHALPLANALKDQGIDLTGRSQGVAEMLYSTGTQYGPATSVVRKALTGKDVAGMTDSEVISTVQDYKAATTEGYFKSSSPAVRASVKRRAGREKQDLLALAGAPGPAAQMAAGQGAPGAPQIPPTAMPAMAGQAQVQAPAASPYDALRQQIMNPSQPEGMSQGKRTALGVLGALSRWGGMPDTASAVLGAQPAGGQQMTLPQQIQAMGAINKMEMDRLKQQGQQTWLGTLDPQQRALAEAGFGSQIAQQQIAGMAPQEPVVPEAPEVVDVGGQDAVWDPQQGAFVPAPTVGMPEIPPESAGGADALTIPQRVTAGNTLGDNYRQEAKPVDEVLTRYDQVRDIDPATADATQDRTLIVALSRALDPNSAVMEGEAESVQRAAGGQGRWANTIRKTWAGEELTPTERTSIIREMSRLAGGAAKKQNKLWDRYAGRAERYGLDPRNVVDEEPYQYTPWGQQAEPAVQEPAVQEPAVQEPGQQYEAQRTIDGAQYVKINGKWYAQ